MYPPAPWHMHGQLWLSVFRTRVGDPLSGSPGFYAVALVRYEEPSPLTYAELLVAHRVSRPLGAVSIDQIWVDSPASVAGGRELWAIPKELADFDERRGRGGMVSRSEWQVSAGDESVLRAAFTDASRVAPRLPFRGACWQPGLGDGPRTARMSGWGRSVPCRARWEFAPEGPLGWLAGHRPVASLRMRNFRMSFG